MIAHCSSVISEAYFFRVVDSAIAHSFAKQVWGVDFPTLADFRLYGNTFSRIDSKWSSPTKSSQRLKSVSVETARSLSSGDGRRPNDSVAPVRDAFRVSPVDRFRHSDKLTGDVGASPPVVGDWPAAAS